MQQEKPQKYPYVQLYGQEKCYFSERASEQYSDEISREIEQFYEQTSDSVFSSQNSLYEFHNIQFELQVYFILYKLFPHKDYMFKQLQSSQYLYEEIYET